MSSSKRNPLPIDRNFRGALPGGGPLLPPEVARKLREDPEWLMRVLDESFEEAAEEHPEPVAPPKE